VGNYATCAAGQTLQFTPFNVPAGGSLTVGYPALLGSSVPNGTLVNSDVWCGTRPRSMTIKSVSRRSQDSKPSFWRWRHKHVILKVLPPFRRAQPVT